MFLPLLCRFRIALTFFDVAIGISGLSLDVQHDGTDVFGCLHQVPFRALELFCKCGFLGPVLCPCFLEVEHALGLFSYRCCVRAALYRGQDCRTCSGVVQLPLQRLCFLVQGAGLQNVRWGLWACLMWALGFVGLSHFGSGVCGPVSH